MRNGDLLLNAPEGTLFAGKARLLSRRHIGKICFCGARFREDQIQIMFNDQLSNYQALVSLPLGSVVEVSGHKITTRTGMPTLQATSALPVFIYTGNMPDKFHGLGSTMRYRNRAEYIMTDEDVFLFVKKMSATLRVMRHVLQEHGFREFSTGILQERFEAGQANSFSTHCRANGKTLHLNLTNELKLKRLIVGGMERVFEIGQSFRNEGIDPIHSPEFTMLEAYAAEANCHEMENLLEELVCEVIRVCEGAEVTTKYTCTDGTHNVSYQIPFTRLPFQRAFERWVGEWKSCDREALTALYPGSFHNQMTRFTWLMKVIERFIVPNIVTPTFLTELPLEMSPFVRSHSDGLTSERSFFVSQGCFLADIYTDENDHKKVANALAKQAAETGNMFNEDYLRVLKLGMPPTAGIGLGVNRLLMLLLGDLPRNIKETILFPIL